MELFVVTLRTPDLSSTSRHAKTLPAPHDQGAVQPQLRDSRTDPISTICQGVAIQISPAQSSHPASLYTNPTHHNPLHDVQSRDVHQNGRHVRLHNCEAQSQAANSSSSFTILSVGGPAMLFYLQPTDEELFKVRPSIHTSQSSQKSAHTPPFTETEIQPRTPTKVTREQAR